MHLIPTPFPAAPAAWAAPLSDVVAKGRTVQRPGGLAGLAAARQEHQGQFFTPHDVAARLWQLVTPTLAQLAGVRKANLLDTSIGSARLFQFAEPEAVTLAGCDPDPVAVAAVAAAVRGAGFKADVVTAGMETCHPTGFDVALLNPPFSLTFRSPHLVGGQTTTYGPFGPHTSALSQNYALEQALRAAPVVAAVLPLQDVEQLSADPSARLGDAGLRLHSAYRLPAGSFRTEGTDVATGIVLFGPSVYAAEISVVPLPAAPSTLQAPVFPLEPSSPIPRLGNVAFDSARPLITQQVTGDNQAVLHHDGRRLVVTTACGFTRARVMNAILGNLLPPPAEGENRRERGVRTHGHYRLDREFLLAQADWRAALADLQKRASDVGVNLSISPTLERHLERRVRANRRQASPFGRTVADPDGLLTAGSRTRSGTMLRPLISDPTRWGAPVIPKGARVTIAADATGGWTLTHDRMTLPASETVLKLHVDIDGCAPLATGPNDTTGWHAVSPDLVDQPACRESVLWWRRRAESLVRSWLWDYQFEDAADLLTKPRGGVAGWDTGLGKARLAAALALVHGGRRSLVVVPARLVPEIVGEWSSLPLPEGWWKVVRNVGELDWSVPVLVIACEHLRAPIRPGGRRTLASVLRKRVGLLVVDEADFLANPGSDRTRAIWQVSARRRILLTATPIANYPRDIFPPLAISAGDGTAAQPYGWHQPECTAEGWTDARLVRRGRDAIRESFTTMAWVTNEFADTLREGAKREIPVIRDLPRFRAALAPVIKRRVHGEPAVARYVRVPTPVWEDPVQVPWDPAHLAHFLRVADEFASWYARYREQMGDRPSSLVMLLARIGAVERAGNDPMHATAGPSGRYPFPTSKQRHAVEHLSALAAEGHRSLCYARHPATLNWMERALAERGVGAVVLHGGRSIAHRTASLERDFRNGDAPVILATFGTGDRGLNLPQVSRVVLLDRDWSARTEKQCIGRTLRPQQASVPHVQPIHLPGSLDDYMAQMTAFKADAALAGIDWGTPRMDEGGFCHMDSIVERFVSDMAARYGMDRSGFRGHLAELVAADEAATSRACA